MRQPLLTLRGYVDVLLVDIAAWRAGRTTALALGALLAAALLLTAAIGLRTAGDAGPVRDAALTAPAAGGAAPSAARALPGQVDIGRREFLPGEEFTGANRTSGAAAETGRQEFLAGEGSMRRLPSVTTVGAGCQQAALSGIEVRDNGAGPTTPSYTYPAVYGDDEGVTQRGAGPTGGDFAPCHEPGRPCDR
jgi:hypothetical protein